MKILFFNIIVSFGRTFKQTIVMLYKEPPPSLSFLKFVKDFHGRSIFLLMNLASILAKFNQRSFSFFHSFLIQHNDIIFTSF